MHTMSRIGSRVVLILFLLLQIRSAPVYSQEATLPVDHPTGPEKAAPGIQPARLDQTLTGVLNIYWGDPLPGGTPLTIFTLTPPAGQPIALEMGAALPLPMDQLIALRGQAVRVTGNWLSAAALSFRFRVTGLSGASPNPNQALEGVYGAQPWASLLCKFADIADEPKTPAYFAEMYSSSYPGLDHYWQQVSYGQINVQGSQATSIWRALPNPRSYYVYDANGDGELDLNFSRAANDCTGISDAEIDFTQFAGINLMFNSNLDGYAWGGGSTMTLDGVTRWFNMTWEPPWGYNNITVIAHEMGHGFGLPHSSGMYGQTYDNAWDVMSDAWSNCDLFTDPVYGCLPQQTISYHRDMLGWIPVVRKAYVASSTQATVTLEPLENGPSENYMLAQVPIDGSDSLFYTVEVRRKLGYDVKLLGEAVIIHEVNGNRGNQAQVIDIDGNADTGDAGAQWLVGETFVDAARNITIAVDSETGSGGFTVTITNGSLPVQCPNVIAGWKGEYWNNADLSGDMVLCRDDFALDFDWQEGSPGLGIPADYFSARWTRTFDFPAGTYRFNLSHDDGAQLYVDNLQVPLIDAWSECCVVSTGETTLTAGPHTLQVVYRELEVSANVHLHWEPVTFQYWRGEYFNNTTLAGLPALVRDDPAIQFEWFSSSPDPLLKEDEFSVRWSRIVRFDGGSYRFDLYHDDGARMWIDGSSVHDDWCQNCVKDGSFTLPIDPGAHLIVLEMYDGGGWAGSKLTWALQDAYEPDNQPAEAKTIQPGEDHVHSIDPSGDVDYVTFDVLEPSRVVLETSGLTGDDTRLWLYDQGLKEIAYDDDSGPDRYSRIELACGPSMLLPGKYYARVEQKSANQIIPSYHLSLALEPCPLIDLVVSSIHHSPTPGQVGQPLRYTIQVVNQGVEDLSDSFEVALYLDHVPASCGQAGVKSWTVPGLAAGIGVELTYDSPGFAAGSAHQVAVMADSTCQAAETLEDNNLLTADIALLPAGFSKSAPLPNATVVSVAPTLTWAAAEGAESYEYCIDRTGDDTCNGGWTQVTETSVALQGLSYHRTYFWQVRAVSQAGSTPANAGAWWQLTTQDLPAACAPTWQSSLTASDAGDGVAILEFGQGAAYSDALDTGCGEALLPPSPPAPSFDARLALPNGLQESLMDFRADDQTGATWTVKFQSGSGPLTFTWNALSLPSGRVRLRDFSEPHMVDIDMRAQNSYTLTASNIDRLQIVYEKAQLACVDLSVSAGWNMVSVPVQASNMQLSAIFPNVVPPAYRFAGSYQTVENLDALVTGQGYWLWFDAPFTYPVCGQVVMQQDIVFSAGWNLFGPFQQPLDAAALTSTPTGIVMPPFYGFTNNYAPASTLQPGKGYWAYAAQAGTLHLANGTAGLAFHNAAPRAQGGGGQSPQDFRLPLTVTGGSGHMTLLLGVAPQATPGFDPGLDLLAPLPPPAGAFDARLTTTQMDYLSDLRPFSAAPLEFVVRFQRPKDASVINLTWDPAALRRLGTFTLVDLASGDRFVLDMTQTGSLTVHSTSVLASGVKIIIVPSTQTNYLFLPALLR